MVLFVIRRVISLSTKTKMAVKIGMLSTPNDINQKHSTPNIYTEKINKIKEDEHNNITKKAFISKSTILTSEDLCYG